MVVVATIATIAAPRYGAALSRYRTDLAVRQIAADLEYAATRARVTSTEIKVKFDAGHKPDESWYEFEGIAHPERPGLPYRVHLRNEPWGVEISQAPGDVQFNIYGGLKNSGTIVVRHGAAERSIVVDKDLDTVTVQ